MPHGPFILAAYAIAAVVLLWCALAPILRGRRLATVLRARHQQTETDHAPQA